MRKLRIFTLGATTIIIVILTILQGANYYGAQPSASSIYSGNDTQSLSALNVTTAGNDTQSLSALNVTTAGNDIAIGVAVSNPLSDSEAKFANDMGAKWIRTDVGISKSVQQTYSAAQTSGLNIIGVVSYWILDNPDSFTEQDWANAIRTVQTSYPEIHVWEIWNEPTCDKYQHGYMDGTPQRYFDLLKAAYTILKAGDPTSRILGIGGAQLGNNGDLNFTAAVFSLGGSEYMDALAIHAYPYQLNEGKDWNYYQQLWSEELEQYTKFNKPIWITETGLRSDQTNESDQSNYMDKSYSFFVARGIKAYIWYEMTDDGTTGNFSIGSWGLLQSNLTPKQAYYTYESLSSQSNHGLNVPPTSPTTSVTIPAKSNGPVQPGRVTTHMNASCSAIWDAKRSYSCSHVVRQSDPTYQ